MSKIIFYPKNNLVKKVIPAPQKIQIPEWYKNLPKYQETKFSDSKTFIVENGETNLSVKSCIPFLDSFTSGYAFYTWADIQIRQIDGHPRITWANNIQELNQLANRDDPKIPSPEGHDGFLFSWISHWGIKTPKNYSCLMTHPFNRTDLPFYTTTGIMDTDKWGIWGNQPFALKTGFEGIIPAGTPIIHIFPFKRENWKSEINESLTDWATHEDIKRSSKFRGYYKNGFWQKKQYE